MNNNNIEVNKDKLQLLDELLGYINDKEDGDIKYMLDEIGDTSAQWAMMLALEYADLQELDDDSELLRDLAINAMGYMPEDEADKYAKIEDLTVHHLQEILEYANHYDADRILAWYLYDELLYRNKIEADDYGITKWFNGRAKYKNIIE